VSIVLQIEGQSSLNIGENQSSIGIGLMLVGEVEVNGVHGIQDR